MRGDALSVRNALCGMRVLGCMRALVSRIGTWLSEGKENLVGDEEHCSTHLRTRAQTLLCLASGGGAARGLTLTAECYMRSGLLDCSQHGYPQSQQRGGGWACKVLSCLFSTPPPGPQPLTAQRKPDAKPLVKPLVNPRAMPHAQGLRRHKPRMLTLCALPVPPLSPPARPPGLLHVTDPSPKLTKLNTYAARDRPIDDVEDTRGYDFRNKN